MKRALEMAIIAVRTRSAKLLGLLLLFSTALFGGLAIAQGANGRITGTAADSNGAYIPDTSVSVTNLDTGVQQLSIHNSEQEVAYVARLVSASNETLTFEGDSVAQ